MSENAIITHGDFDGLISATLVGKWSGISLITFTGPESVRRIDIGPGDFVCDLPHPMRKIRGWFDHHPGNIEEAKSIGLDIGEGAAREAPSAARVVYEHLKDRADFPLFMEETVAAGDRIDSMAFATIGEWLSDAPENVLNRTIFLAGEDLRAARPFMHWLTRTLIELPLSKIVEFPDVRQRHAKYQEQAKRFADVVTKTGEIIADGDILLLNFSEMKIPPKFSRNHAYEVHPNVRAVLTVSPIFQAQRRTNDLRFSISLNPFIPNEGAPDLAAIFDDLEIGGGHPGAAGGRITAESKDARIRLFKQVLADIQKEWKARKIDQA